MFLSEKVPGLLRLHEFFQNLTNFNIVFTFRVIFWVFKCQPSSIEELVLQSCINVDQITVCFGRSSFVPEVFKFIFMWDCFKSFRCWLFLLLDKTIINQKLFKSESAHLGSQFLWHNSGNFLQVAFIFELSILGKGNISLVDAVVDTLVFSDGFFSWFNYCLFDECASQVQIIRNGFGDDAVDFRIVRNILVEIVFESSIHACLQRLSAGDLSQGSCQLLHYISKTGLEFIRVAFQSKIFKN